MMNNITSEGRTEANKNLDSDIDVNFWRKVITNPKFRIVWIILLLSTLITFIPKVYSDKSISCQLAVLQYFLAPHFCASILLSGNAKLSVRQKHRVSMTIGMIIGLITATTYFTFFYLWGRDYYYLTHNQFVQPWTSTSFYITAIFVFYSWIVLIVVSTISGWIASVFPISYWLNLTEHK